MGNSYLDRQVAMKQRFLDIGMDTGFQKCWDLIQLCLRNPDVVGKDTFGKERIKRLHKALKKFEHEFGMAWFTEKESDVLQEKLDDNLREIWGDELYVFKDRYPYLKQPGYQKAKKGWK